MKSEAQADSHLIGRRQPGERGEKSRMRRRPADGAQRAWANPARSGRRRPGTLARAWRGRARRGRGGAQRCWPRCSTGGGRTCERRGTGGEGTRATCPSAGGAVWVEGRRRRRAETARRLGRRAPADVRCLARQKGGARPGRESVSGVVRREARARARAGTSWRTTYGARKRPGSTDLVNAR